MENQDLLIKQVTEKAKTWLSDGYDAETQAEVRRMLEADDKTELIECFYKDLEFGTGGLRGIMGAGSNRMNIYTVGSATQGLANYLIGGVDNVDSVIVHSDDIKKLSVLPVGTIPPNPAELLESNTFADLLAKLRTEYDYVIIDCPPIEMMADAQIIETLVDRTIFVVRAGLLERVMVPEIDRLYSEKKFKNMGLVLNGTLSGTSRYGHKYGYGYGYSDKKRKKKNKQKES